MVVRYSITARHTRVRRLIVLTTAVAAVSTAYTAASASPPNDQPMTPNQCIALNGGDYNACNVGNSGRGDLHRMSLSA